MRIPGTKLHIGRRHLIGAVPVLLVLLIGLGWAARHHLDNEAYRLGYLARGVQRAARLGAERIRVGEVAAIGCEATPAWAGGVACGRWEPTVGSMQCSYREPCAYGSREQQERLRDALHEIMLDLQYLPYFSRFHRERRFGRDHRGAGFTFDVGVYRLLESGNFIQVAARQVPENPQEQTFGIPAPLVRDAPEGLARATTAWRTGEMSEWVTPQHYLLFWPLREGAGTAALLALRVEREQHSLPYVVGLVVMLTFYFISLAVIFVVSTLFYGVTWFFNAFPFVLLGAVAVFLLFLYYRRQLLPYLKNRTFRRKPS